MNINNNIELFDIKIKNEINNNIKLCNIIIKNEWILIIILNYVI